MKQCSFYEILKDQGIKVPIIQRDYVQGRDNHIAKKKIVDFIETISTHLKSGDVLPLNFIYGYKDNETFIPIDGQQRLTTLYLLYLYVFIKAKGKTEANSLRELNYLVRPSSNRFFNALRSHLDCLTNSGFESETPVSKTIGSPKKYEDDENDLSEFLNNCFIVKENWFRKCWLNDLTVRSSIIVLYLIKESLKGIDIKEVYSKLVDTANPIIWFSYLEMGNVGSADETYVKMNARGKQLTPFENLKAEIYAYYRSNPDPKQFDEFKKNIDSSWLSLALKLIVKNINISGAAEDELEEIDSTIFALFNAIQTNNMVADNLKSDSVGFVSDSVFNMRQCDISLKEYLPNEEDCRLIVDAGAHYNNCLSKSIEEFSLLMEYLNGFISDNNQLEIIRNNIYKIWDEGEKETQHYNERLIVFSMIRFLKNVDASVPDRDLYFSQWIKAFRHIIDHSEIDKPEKYINAICNIKDDLDFSILNSGSLYNQAKTLLNPLKSPFNSAQIKDEILKANYRLKTSAWETAISRFEENDYFLGQSIFLLIPGRTLTDAEYIQYWEKTREIFLNYDKNNNPLLCLFCSKGFLPKLDDGKKSYSYGYYDSQHHTYDWRGIFEGPCYVKEYVNVLDDYIASKKTFSDYVNDIVVSNRTKPIPDYQTQTDKLLAFVLSQNYNTYEFFKQGRYTFKGTGGTKCLLLKNTGLNIDDTLDLSIAYILLKYKNAGFKEQSIDFANNEITMKKGAISFRVRFDSSKINYTLNGSIHTKISDVIDVIDKL